MEGLGLAAGIAIASLLLTIVGQRFHMGSDYVQSLERRLHIAEERAEKAEEEHDKCDQDKEELKRVFEGSERERSRLERDNYRLYTASDAKDRHIAELEQKVSNLGGTP